MRLEPVAGSGLRQGVGEGVIDFSPERVFAHRGSWTLAERSPGRTAAVCRLFTDPDDTPAWVIDRATKKMIGWMFDSLLLQTNRGRYQKTGR